MASATADTLPPERPEPASLVLQASALPTIPTAWLPQDAEEVTEVLATKQCVLFPLFIQLSPITCDSKVI